MTLWVIEGKRYRWKFVGIYLSSYEFHNSFVCLSGVLCQNISIYNKDFEIWICIKIMLKRVPLIGISWKNESKLIFLHGKYLRIKEALEKSFVLCKQAKKFTQLVIVCNLFLLIILIILWSIAPDHLFPWTDYWFIKKIQWNLKR